MKIGVLSPYYKSKNYGGLLQAYALIKVLEQFGYDAEQISFMHETNVLLRKNKINALKKILQDTLGPLYEWLKYIKHLRTFINEKKASKGIHQREVALDRFGQSIPHTRPYTYAELMEAPPLYDLYIVGSDQVWNPRWLSKVLLLDFVPDNVPKFSYAASIASPHLTDNECMAIKNSLCHYLAVSVREEGSIEQLKLLYTGSIEWVLDPTLLLSIDDWDVICEPRQERPDYIFCYFLGDSSVVRRVAHEYAVKFGLQIVTLPHLCHYKTCDEAFGDEQLYFVSPEKWISLIKGARCVLTDSFHASVFSIIYHRQFFVFERPTKEGSMKERLYSLTRLFDMSDRFCDTGSKMSCEYLCSRPPIDYKGNYPMYEKMKERSLQFLDKTIKKADIKSRI